MRAVANTAPSRRFTSRLGRVTPSVIACLAVVAGLLITAPTASAAGFSSTGVIFDSITGNTPTGSVTANATNWKAAQFITPDADANIKLVSVVLNLASNPLGTSFEVAIYDARADGSEPKDRVGQTLLAPQTIVIGNNTFTPGNSFPELDKSKEYWVVVKGGSSSVLWSTAGATGVISPASQSAALIATRLNNGEWNSSPAAGNPFMMTVNPVAVPEPSTWAMGLAGLGFAAVKALRRRRQGCPEPSGSAPLLALPPATGGVQPGPAGG